MSGYLEGVLVLLAINVVFAYGAFLPLAAGQLNLGVAGFAAIGAYTSAYLSNLYKIEPVLAIPVGAIVAGLIGLIVAVPVLRTRGIYLALATFAVGQIVKATILNLEFIGGAAGYPVAAFIRLPTVLAFAISIVLLVWLSFQLASVSRCAPYMMTSPSPISWASEFAEYKSPHFRSAQRLQASVAVYTPIILAI